MRFPIADVWKLETFHISMLETVKDIIIQSKAVNFQHKFASAVFQLIHTYNQNWFSLFIRLKLLHARAWSW